MNLTDYTYILNKPEAINDRQTAALEKIVDEFPYFQSARALRLKGLYNQDSFKYNYALKVTAAHTTDRSVLFDFITSDSFTVIQQKLFEQKTSALHNIVVADMEIIAPEAIPTQTNTIESSLLNSIQNSGTSPAETSAVALSHIIEQEVPVTKPILEEAPLEIGKPLEFSRNETHSFREWLQLSAFKPIDRDTVGFSSEQPPEVKEELTTEETDKQKKNEIINRFIEANPKIAPVRDHAPAPVLVVESSDQDQNYLMTETLARVYLEQKKYSKAIQAYQILILKYPEKSSFFADRILDIKHLQQNNNNK